ncbi:MAG TPA: TetR/AcrR family transcriptional regulator [Opitutaceae bacterium]|jgi:TetR/AcrR family transcriptional repressor of nem operon|nr:TetR/AcrR family transcriptional regulator [Opitutaceae bacterium]
MGRTSDAHERLMTAALDLVWEESYGAVTIDNICQRAGVKKGSFYYFYKSKSDLAVAALERMWAEEWKPNLDRLFSASVEPVARIQGFLEQLHLKQVERFRKYGKVCGCPAASVGSEVSTQEQAVCAKVREIMARKMRYLESAIRDGIADGSIEKGDPAEKARNLGFLIEGAVSQSRIMNDPDLLRNLPASALDLLRARSLSSAN